MTRLREIAAPFVAAAPAGVRVRARLRVSSQDAEVLAAAGRHLGSLAGRDLAARCAEGRLDASGRAASRAVRKRALTGQSSSRWAGAITRASEDACQLAARNLAAEQGTLKARVRKIETRLAVPAGKKAERVSGYATSAERHGKTIQLKALKGRLAAAGLTQAQWRGRRGRSFRRLVAGIPTARFRDRLVQMTANAGLSVIVADPAYTSRWGRSTGSRPCGSITPRRPVTTLRRW